MLAPEIRGWIQRRVNKQRNPALFQHTLQICQYHFLSWVSFKDHLWHVSELPALDRLRSQPAAGQINWRFDLEQLRQVLGCTSSPGLKTDPSSFDTVAHHQKKFVLWRFKEEGKKVQTGTFTVRVQVCIVRRLSGKINPSEWFVVPDIRKHRWKAAMLVAWLRAAASDWCCLMKVSEGKILPEQRKTLIICINHEKGRKHATEPGWRARGVLLWLAQLSAVFPAAVIIFICLKQPPALARWVCGSACVSKAKQTIVQVPSPPGWTDPN